MSAGVQRLPSRGLSLPQNTLGLSSKAQHMDAYCPIVNTPAVGAQPQARTRRPQWRGQTAPKAVAATLQAKQMQSKGKRVSRPSAGFTSPRRCARTGHNQWSSGTTLFAAPGDCESQSPRRTPCRRAA